MVYGILEPKTAEPVPGTASLEDIGGRVEVAATHDHNLKVNKDGVILQPQPSDSEDDPLNWPLWQRDLITVLLCLLAIIASTMSSMLACNTVTMIIWFGGLTVTQAAMLTGYHLLGVGISGFFFVATARVYGKRHLWIIAPIFIIASSVGGGYAGHNDYNGMVVARFFQGFGLGPLEGLVNVAVGDMYFVHESGLRLAFSNMCLYGGALFTPVIVGITTQNLGWQWSFWFIAIFTGALYPAVYLICAETSFPREDPALAAAISAKGPSSRTGNAASDSSLDEAGVANHSEKHADVGGETTETRAASHAPNVHHAMPRKLISARSLRIFNGRKTNESFWKMFFRPLPMFFNPAITWAALVQGVMIAWLSLIGTSLALVLIQLGFNEAQTGYMYTGAFIGAIVAFIFAGATCDPWARWITHRNGGVFEPEFRLFLIWPMLAVSLVGLFGYGYAAENAVTVGWATIAAMFGFVVAGAVLGSIVSAQYIVDGYREVAIEGFTCLLLFKNLFTYGILYRALDWLNQAGDQGLFFDLGYAQLAICLTTIPLYIYGKRLRAFFGRHDLLAFFRLR